ncbi:hypothetical protein OCHUTO_0430 [Orientia chuto str. Dubai]|uniref:Uncharacterized protein n=1 Tax=Orientia chuto str. Dubai TaxID=1359168 RepID=A0A0F3MPI3_9RICK|nr:hypothetical protein [Candidatus Orientia mediorientalis]KJV56524.1 hypothetical protein OCHUTO_0430 [Orientia chuto str. Dubai]
MIIITVLHDTIENSLKKKKIARVFGCNTAVINHMAITLPTKKV